jgi:Domain of unknown function (DUF222)
MSEGREAGLGEWSLERLEDEIGRLAAHIHAATCRWLLLVGEFDRRDGWEPSGCRSCAHWLSWRCGVSSAAAREQVRVARRLGELPAIRAAFGRGELSYSKVRALSRVASRELEGELLELARYATASQLERVLRAYRGVIARERTGLDNAHGERYLRLDCDDDGSVVIRGRLPAEEGALVAVALAAARDGLRDGRSNFEPRGRGAEGEPSTLGRGVSAEKSTAADASSPAAVYERAPVSNADGLVLMAETLLSAGAAELGGGERYQVVVHVDVGALAGAAADGEQRAGACQLENGELLHAETARRLACDASLVRILERDGRPLSVGRRSRSVPPALNRALRSRDRGCCFPGCPNAASSTPTTSTTGPAAGGPSWPTWSGFAATTTGCSTTAATRSSAAPTASSASAAPTDAPSSRSPPPGPATATSSSATTNSTAPRSSRTPASRSPKATGST